MAFILGANNSGYYLIGIAADDDAQGDM